MVVPRAICPESWLRQPSGYGAHERGPHRAGARDVWSPRPNLDGEVARRWSRRLFSFLDRGRAVIARVWNLVVGGPVCEREVASGRAWRLVVRCGRHVAQLHRVLGPATFSMATAIKLSAVACVTENCRRGT